MTAPRILSIEEDEHQAATGAALAALTAPELKRFAALVNEFPAAPTPIPALLRAMAEEGYINLGWIADQGGDETVVFDDPALTAIATVATLAAEPFWGKAGEDAWRIYHRIIGADPGTDDPCGCTPEPADTCPEHGEQPVTGYGSTRGPDPYAISILGCGHQVICLGPGDPNTIVAGA